MKRQQGAVVRQEEWVRKRGTVPAADSGGCAQRKRPSGKSCTWHLEQSHNCYVSKLALHAGCVALRPLCAAACSTPCSHMCGVAVERRALAADGGADELHVMSQPP